MTFSWQVAEVLVAVPGLAVGQGLVAGTVTSDTAHKRPLVGVEVSIPAVHKSTRTDSTGFYHIDGLAIGRYTVSVRAVGRQPRIDTLTVTSDDAVLHDFVLTDLAYPLDTVVSASEKTGFVSPAMRGFDERRKLGFGHFYPQEVLRKNDNDKLTDFARRIPGAKLIRSGTHTYLASSRRSGQAAILNSNRPCFATVYVDGVLIFDSKSTPRQLAALPPPDLQDFNVNDLGAIEFYGGEATAPPGFRQSGCGLLLIWSREH